MTSFITLVVTCRARLEHLKLSLPGFIRLGFPVIVVDYGCPEFSGDYVLANYPGVHVVKVEGKQIFNISDARNAGGREVKTDHILFADADNIFSQSYGEYLCSLPLDGMSFWNGIDAQLSGHCLIPKFWFDKLGGFDEIIVGWGYDEVDFYKRLIARGLEQKKIPSGFIKALPHSDQKRDVAKQHIDKWSSQRLNAIYSGIKRSIEGIDARNIGVEERIYLRDVIEKHYKEGKTTIDISVGDIIQDSTNNILANGRFKISRKIVFTVTIPSESDQKL